MKLQDHTQNIKDKINSAFNKHLSRLGLGQSKVMELDKLPEEIRPKRLQLDEIITNHQSTDQTYEQARAQVVDELTFTLFNRLAAIKVMEAHLLFPEIITRRAEHGERSFGHKVWLEEHPDQRQEELEGYRAYLKYAFDELSQDIPLYARDYPYALLPYVIDLKEVIDAVNAVTDDKDIDADIWQSDDILGWLYESFNTDKKIAHKDSKDKTEYHKVSIQSQVYTPRWVVEFLVNNSLGKLYLEMYPDSSIRDSFQIANAPDASAQPSRRRKSLKDIKLIDPAIGSGNFALYSFDLLYVLYVDQIEHYNLDMDKADIPRSIIENNLHGVDLDDRAIQLAHLGLYIKAKLKNRNVGQLNFNIVSSAFVLPAYEVVQPIFGSSREIDDLQKSIIQDTWEDLRNAHKFGSLLKINERIKQKISELKDASTGRKKKDLFTDADLNLFERFEVDFFKNLQSAVAKHAQAEGKSFLSDKTQDAITFLKLLTQSYDIATANPPYTDSSDFGPDLKKFIETNYKKPHKFHTNLYATFIKRCYDFLNDDGKMALVHPPTFMYIKTFEGVRKFILENTSIDLFVEWGYLGMFHQSARVDAAMYVINKNKLENDTTFIKLNHIYEGKRYDAFVEAYESLMDKSNHTNIYHLPQSKLKVIKQWPFIYWISDGFREKFDSASINEVLKVRQGIATGNNNRCLRFWWEIDSEDISSGVRDGKKWVGYCKGGPFKKWFGNLWLVVNFGKEGYQYLSENGNHLPSKDYYYLEGLTYSASGSKGASFRYLPLNNVFDVGGSCIFPDKYRNVDYSIGFMNSSLCSYITQCLNPTVNTQVGDLKRVPFVIPHKDKEIQVSALVKENIEISTRISSFNIYERGFENSPLSVEPTRSDLKIAIKDYLDKENFIICVMMINEFLVNKVLFDIYDLNEADIEKIKMSSGISTLEYDLHREAKVKFLKEESEFTISGLAQECIDSISELSSNSLIEIKVKAELKNLYKSNFDFEEFCIKHKVNPINVWYWFKESNIVPEHRAKEIAMEFLADMIRTILMEDDDGIIPLVDYAGESMLLQRIEEKFYEQGFTAAQYASFDKLLGKSLPEYLNKHFFQELSDHLNLFMYLPKTPFIWHLTSGPYQGFDCYIIIYKWDRDKLFRIKSQYIEKRERVISRQLQDLKAKKEPTITEQEQIELIGHQIREIDAFKIKIDELLEDGYNPILDDGVGKNIAPLQKKDMLAYEVLNKGQLKKYLEADW